LASERTNVYEAMVIFDSNRFARERAGLPAEVEKMIQAEGGEVLVTRLWEERRLAYPIKGQRKGTYWLYYFRGPTSMLTTLNRQWEIHDGVLRHLVLKVHPHIVDAVIEHAKAGPTQHAPAAPAHAGAGGPRMPAVEVPEDAGN
jgi:small subunit ribosomal protein S6